MLHPSEADRARFVFEAALRQTVTDACYVPPVKGGNRDWVRDRIRWKGEALEILGDPDVVRSFCELSDVRIEAFAKFYLAAREKAGLPLNRNELATLKRAGWRQP